LEDNTADMSEINFSVANEILRSLDDYGNNEVFK
jgi:ribosomal protein S25